MVQRHLRKTVRALAILLLPILLMLGVQVSAVKAFAQASSAPVGQIVATDAKSTSNSLFVRFEPDNSEFSGRLQTAIVTYVNVDGIELNLVAAIHIADKAYYQQLNDYFKTQDAVLYELVAPAGVIPSANSSSSVGNPISFLQQSLKKLLGLTFQLDEIEYSARNFVHADLSPKELSDAMTDRGENLFSIFIRMMITEMAYQDLNVNDDSRRASSSLQLGSLVVALRSEQWRDSLKYLFAEQLASGGGVMNGLDGDSGIAILTDRNQAALAVLAEQLLRPELQRVSIFYGAAHFPSIEKELLGNLNFKWQSTHWITSWTIGDGG